MTEVPKTLFTEHPRVIHRVRFGKDNVPKTLHYFALRGLGEIPRLLLEYTETPYNSVMYFGTNEYKQFAPFGQMPCYQGPELGEGNVIAQSAAICRHIARETGIWGTSLQEIALQDMLWEAGKDIMGKLELVHKEGPVDERFDGLLQGLIRLKKEGKCLSECNRSYGEGANLGYGEIGVFHSLYSIMEIKPGFFDPYPELLRFANAIAETPTINRYLQSPRRMPLTQNEMGKGSTGATGYTYISDLKSESVAELYEE